MGFYWVSLGSAFLPPSILFLVASWLGSCVFAVGFGSWFLFWCCLCFCSLGFWVVVFLAGVVLGADSAYFWCFIVVVGSGLVAFCCSHLVSG